MEENCEQFFFSLVSLCDPVTSKGQRQARKKIVYKNKIVNACTCA